MKNKIQVNNFQQHNVTMKMSGVTPYVGERLEIICERMEQNNEPINAQRDLVYQERSEGVIPAYNIRADKWDYAIEANELGVKAIREGRKSKMEEIKKKVDEEKNNVEKNN